MAERDPIVKGFQRGRDHFEKAQIDAAMKRARQAMRNENRAQSAEAKKIRTEVRLGKIGEVYDLLRENVPVFLKTLGVEDSFALTSEDARIPHVLIYGWDIDHEKKDISKFFKGIGFVTTGGDNVKGIGVISAHTPKREDGSLHYLIDPGTFRFGSFWKSPEKFVSGLFGSIGEAIAEPASFSLYSYTNQDFSSHPHRYRTDVNFAVGDIGRVKIFDMPQMRLPVELVS